MPRKARVDENGIKRGAWSREEDDKLKSYVQKYGHWNWRQLPKFAKLSRCGKSCRLRWLNYLRKDVKTGNYSEEEAQLIIKLQKEHGNKWSLISSKLPGRTDNDIKNYWHSCLKKRPSAVGSGDDECNKISERIESQRASTSESCSQLSGEVAIDLNLKDEHSNRINSNSEDGNTSLDFWSEPFLLDIGSDDTEDPIFPWFGTDDDFVTSCFSYYDHNTHYFAHSYNNPDMFQQ